MDDVRRAPEVPGVPVVEITAERHLERYDFLKRKLAQRRSQSLLMGVRIVIGLGGALDDLPELVGWHRGRGHRSGRHHQNTYPPGCLSDLQHVLVTANFATYDTSAASSCVGSTTGHFLLNAGAPAIV